MHDCDEAGHAAHLVRRTALAEGIAGRLSKPVVHGDYGATLKATGAGDAPLAGREAVQLAATGER